MIILGIESSCDDTAAAVLHDDEIKSNVISSQSVHKQFGGVVPELASRAHHKTIWQTVRQALNESDVSAGQLDAVAVTQGPGLMGSLLVGLCFAKGFCISNKLPLIGVNHMDAHIYANFIDEQPEFPFVALTVSGGHTRLELVKSPFEHVLLGKTRDDAAGEAFDKIGKLLDLPYPGGPEIDKLARHGDPAFHTFPQALKNKGLDFSFSGLKTSALYYLQDKDELFIKKNLSHICASVSDAITEVLISKLKRAVKKTNVQTVLLAGGVSANSMLREKVNRFAEQEELKLYIPKISYCTDNAAMIAMTGKMKYDFGATSDMSLKAFASLPN